MTATSRRSSHGLNATEKTAFLWASISVILVLLGAFHQIAVSSGPSRFKCPTCAAVSAGSMADGFASVLHNLPRFTFDGRSVSSSFDATNPDYWFSILMIAIPGPVIAILCLLCFPVVFCCRSFCHICGDSRPRQKPYTKKEVNFARVAMFILTGLAVIGAIVGLVGNSMFSDGLGQGFVTLVNFSSNVRDIGQTISKLVGTTFLNQTSAMPAGSFLGLDSGANSVLVMTEATRATVMSYDAYRVTALIVAYLVCVGCGVFGVLAILLKNGKFAIVMLALMWLSLFVVWILFGFFFTIAVMLADLCFAIDSTAKEVDGPLSILLSCSASLVSMADSVLQWLNSMLSETNNALSQAAVGSVLATELGQQKTKLEGFIASVTKLKTCAFVEDAFNGLKATICVSMLNAMALLFIGAIIIGIAWFFGMFVGLMGVKRFDKRNIQKPGTDYDLADSLLGEQGRDAVW